MVLFNVTSVDALRVQEQGIHLTELIKRSLVHLSTAYFLCTCMTLHYDRDCFG